MSHKAENLIIVKNAGSLVPEGYLKLAEKSFVSYGGLAQVLPDGLMVMTDNATVAEGSTNTLQTEDKESVMYIALGKDDKPNPDNIQPFVLLKTPTGDPLMAVLIDGDFVDHVDETSVFSAARNYCNTVLQPKINFLYRKNKNDIDAVMVALSAPEISDDLLKQGIHTEGDHFCIGFIANTKEPKNRTRLLVNDKSIITGEYSWGMVSRSLGWNEETSMGVHKLQNDPPMTMAQKIAARKAGSTNDNVVTLKQPEKTTSALGEKLTKAIESAASLSESASGIRVVNALPKPTFGRPPESLRNQSQNNKRAWYSKWCTNNQPSGWKDCAHSILKTDKVDAFIKSGGQLTDDKGKDIVYEPGNKTETSPAANPSAPTQNPPTAPAKVSDPAKSPQPNIAASKAGSDPLSPILSANEKKEAEAFLKTLDMNGLPLLDPAKLTAERAKYPTFVEQVPGAESIASIMTKWSAEKFAILVEQYPKLAYVLLLDLQHIMVNDMKKAAVTTQSSEFKGFSRGAK